MTRFPWIAGLCLMAATVVGATWAINNNNAPVVTKPKDDAPPLVVIFGKVDGELGVIPIIPSQPGEVIEVLEERAMVEENQVILKMDSVIARLRVKEAELDFKSAEVLLKKANQGLKILDSKKEQQKQAIIASEKDKEAKKAELDLNLKKAKEIGQPIDTLLKTSLEAELARIDARTSAEQEKLKELDLLKSDLQNDILRATEEVESKKLQKERAQYGLDKCEVRAPYRGMVLQTNVRKGQLLTGQERFPPMQFLPMPLPKDAKAPTEIRYYVKGEVIQEWAGRVKKGMTVQVEDDAYQGERFEGKITRLSPWMGPKRQIIIEPFMTNDQNTVECTVEIYAKVKADNSRHPLSPEDLLIGQRVRIIVYPEKN